MNGLMTGKRKHKPESGFTLMEVTIAVLILSTALVTLLGLQSSILARALKDEEKQQAMLIARTILSAIEIHSDEIDAQDSTSSVDDLLQKLHLNLKDKDNEETLKKFDFMARLKVENIGVKDVGDNLIKSVTLSIYPKDNQTVNQIQQNSFDVTYLIPLEEQDDEKE